MEYRTYTTGDGTKLYIIHSKAYTHTYIDYNFYWRSGKDNASKALVNKILMQGCRKYPTLQSISMATDREFGARIQNKVAKVGDVHESGFIIDVLTSENLTKGQKTLENMVALLGETIGWPLICGGSFNEDYFRMAKSDLEIKIQTSNVNKNYVAKTNFMRKAIDDTAFNHPASGTEEEVKALEMKDAFVSYLMMLEFSPRKAFIATNLDPDYVAGLFDFRLPIVREQIFISEPPKKNPSSVTEDESQFDQCMVYVAFPVEKQEELKEREAFNLLNFCVGGYSEARLFTEIRTKRDMAYGAYSSYDDNVGLVIGSAGVDIRHKGKTIDIMLKEFRKAAEGKVSKSHFEKSKRFLLNLRQMGMHSKVDRLDFLERCVLKDKLDRTYDYETAFHDVTHDDVVKASAFISEGPIVYSLLQEQKK
ncbi:MAG: insulinase family protein [Candidatus Woesearchaeota archaeon]